MPIEANNTPRVRRCNHLGDLRILAAIDIAVKSAFDGCDVVDKSNRTRVVALIGDISGKNLTIDGNWKKKTVGERGWNLGRCKSKNEAGWRWKLYSHYKDDRCKVGWLQVGDCILLGKLGSWNEIKCKVGESFGWRTPSFMSFCFTLMLIGFEIWTIG